MNSEHHRIEIAGHGIGEISEDAIRQRAMELARMDGRPSPHSGDHAAAKAELQGIHPPSPEETSVTSQIAEWDEAPSTTGTRAEINRPENDENPSEALIQEGIDEADHDSRVEASKRRS